jgi:hypothetical protein
LKETFKHVKDFNEVDNRNKVVIAKFKKKEREEAKK